jgi:hypothetical protein
MEYRAIRVWAFWQAIARAFWQIRAVLVCLMMILAADIGVMVMVSSCPGRAVREAIGWFFGNGSGVQNLSWPQMVCCIMSAVFGYIFLGILLAVVVQAFRHAENS